jgi:hypothetical protein
VNHVYAEYNADYLTPEQIEFLHAGLLADLAEFAEVDAKPEADPQPEPEPEAEL